MVYDHMVKVNGRYYQAGEDAPEIDDMSGGESSLPYSDDNITLETQEDKPYTKSDIQRMKKAELIEIARNTGVEGADDMTREELAEYLLNVFGL